MPNPTRIRGVLPVFSTPYKKNGTIDAATFEKEIDWIYESGADGIVMAMVSEILRLSSEEREQLAKLACKFGSKRGAVIIGVGAESSLLAERYARQAQGCGADAVIAIPPVSVALGEDELLAYYRQIIKAVKIPVIVQDASGYVGKPMPIKMQAKLLDEYGPIRVQYKPEATPIGPKLSELRDATGGKARIFEGTGGIALIDSYRRGIVGTMPGSDLLWALVPLWKSLVEGNWKRAYRIWQPLACVIDQQKSLDAFLSIEKYLLVKQGIFKNTIVRGPVSYHLDEETRKEIDYLVDLLKEAVEGE